MKRLTEKHFNSDIHYMKCSDNCELDVNCIDCPAFEELIERLAAYEDTGTTPEIVEALKLSTMGRAIAEIKEFNGLPIERLKNIAEANKDGRVVVLPCKVGETVWAVGRVGVPRKMELEPPDIRLVCTDEDNRCMALCPRKPDGFCAYRLRNDGADIGITVFLTREEAEAALKEDVDNG